MILLNSGIKIFQAREGFIPSGYLCFNRCIMVIAETTRSSAIFSSGPRIFPLPQDSTLLPSEDLPSHQVHTGEDGSRNDHHGKNTSAGGEMSKPYSPFLHDRSHLLEGGSFILKMFQDFRTYDQFFKVIYASSANKPQNGFRQNGSFVHRKKRRSNDPYFR